MDSPRLDIIVTHYNEPWEVGEKLFSILNLQRGVDLDSFRVTVVNDGPECHIPDEHFTGLKYPLRQIDIEHGGVSAARNAGLDAAEAEWVMFCDFDDTFAGIYAMRDIMHVLPAKGYNMLHGKLMAEYISDDRDLVYYPRETQKYVYCHGKLYRRQFLLDNNLRFDTELVFNEDSEFNALLITMCHYSTIGDIKSEMPIYCWISRTGSVTRSGREDEAALGQFRRNLKVTEANKKRGEDHYCGMITRTVYDTWYMVQGKRISQSMKDQIMEQFVPWISDPEHLDRLGHVNENILRQIIDIARYELLEPDDVVSDSLRIVRAWVEANIAKRKGVA